MGLTLSRRRCVASWLRDWDRASTAAPQLAVCPNGRHRPGRRKRPDPVVRAPRLFGVVPPRPRLVAVRSVDAANSCSWAEFAATYRRTRKAHLEQGAGRSSKAGPGRRCEGGLRTRLKGQAAPNQGRSASSSWRGPTHRSSEAIGHIAYSEIQAMFL